MIGMVGGMFKKRVLFLLVFIDSTGLRVDAGILKTAIERSEIPVKSIRFYDGRDSVFKKLLSLWFLWFEKHILQRQLIAFHLENINAKIKPLVNTNILVPNQEWLHDSTEKLIDDQVYIWCKTHYATQIFKNKFPLTSFIGFCSRDLINRSIEKQRKSFLHIAGKSLQKGTEAILDVWQKHPEWPELVVICRVPELIKHSSCADNIKIISEFISDSELVYLMNRHGIHLCLSETEGFGHYIHEGMSARAVVLTTNAPPMTEFINAQCGILVNYNGQSKQCWSETYFVSRSDLEKKVIEVLQSADSQLDKLSDSARKNYLKNDSQFIQNLDSRLCSIIHKLSE